MIPDTEALIRKTAVDLKQLLRKEKIGKPLIIGIRTGGVWVAEALHRLLELKEPLGELNINFYRDDFKRIGLHPRAGPSRIPVPIENRTIILVDDVLQTGRTIRAAMNEIFDYGRPACVKLVILVDRGDHELPIAADITAQKITLPKDKNINLRGPKPLKLEIV